MPSNNPRPPFDPSAFTPRELWDFLSGNVEAHPEGGSFRIFGERLLIMRPHALVDLQKHLEQTVGLSAKGFLYLAGEKSAREGHALFERLSPANPEGATDEFAALAKSVAPMAFLGWGRFAVAPADPASHRYLVTLENSPIAEAYGPSKKPVCHLLAGWVAGTAELVLGRSFLCDEIACKAMGIPRCDFQLRPMPHL